ncbi:hypothetical protein [Candidatus Finniella inopinata]|uniref:Uncharacterized protein n=1 Tax=Candidatus Finniella inopinata TaxID=1696036 RepID=A0A4Q7DI74_9PROT|nr:hypothetical protein [Candidatus Finniella inopinata]RZI46671.1 hypothetical protein EQU50_03550 [Candidatus Finniella inopinata]
MRSGYISSLLLFSAIFSSQASTQELWSFEDSDETVICVINANSVGTSPITVGLEYRDGGSESHTIFPMNNYVFGGGKTHGARLVSTTPAAITAPSTKPAWLTAGDLGHLENNILMLRNGYGEVYQRILGTGAADQLILKYQNELNKFFQSEGKNKPDERAEVVGPTFTWDSGVIDNAYRFTWVLSYQLLQKGVPYILGYKGGFTIIDPDGNTVHALPAETSFQRVVGLGSFQTTPVVSGSVALRPAGTTPGTREGATVALKSVSTINQPYVEVLIR